MFAPPGSWVAWKATGELAVDPTNGSSTGLLDPRTHAWSDEACAAFDVDPDRLPPVRRSDAVLGPVLGWLCEATGLSAETLVVLGAGDEMAATLGAGVVEPGAVCDVLGTAEPVCAVVGEPAHDPTGVVELHPHADPDTWLLENPGWLSGGAYRWFRDELGGLEAVRATESGADVYELLERAWRRRAPPGADGVLWVPALAGAMAPEWNADARAGWFGVTASHGRAHLARALLEGNAHALRDVIEAIAGAGHAPTEVVCVGGGAHGRLLLELRAHVTGLPVVPARGRRDDRPRRRDARRGRRGAAPERGRGRAGDGVRARGAGPARPRSCAASTTICTAGTGSCTTRCGHSSTGHEQRLDPASRRRALEVAASGRARRPHRRRRHHRHGRGARRRHPRLAVGLVEARDLAAGTSSASSKLIHGGLRYLEMGDIGLVREALRERELLLTRIAPHLVKPVPFLWPLRGRGWERAYLGAGLVLYDSIGGARSVPRHRHLSRRGALAAAPALRDDALVGAVQFHDALDDDARMVAVVARTAARARRADRHARAGHGISRPRRGRGGRRGDGGAARAARPPRRERRRARGPTACASSPAGARRGATSTRRASTSSCRASGSRWSTGVLARTEKSVLFVIPWQGGWLIGDTDTPWSGGADRRWRHGADVDYLLAKTNALLAEPLRRDDVYGVTAGLRPLVAEAARSDTTRISRQHVVESPAPGLTTIAGGKYTTYRVMAADLIDAVARALG